MALAQTSPVVVAPFFCCLRSIQEKPPAAVTRVEHRDLRTFGCLEREQQKSGVTTTEEVRASVLAVWKALEPSKFEKNVDRIIRFVYAGVQRK